MNAGKEEGGALIQFSENLALSHLAIFLNLAGLSGN